MTTTASVGARFREVLEELGVRGRALVAVSGGLDSTVLLHLARFAARDAGCEWIAAHLDHGMRPTSGEDARWVAGLCRAWEIPVRIERVATPPTSEESAREARYAYLERVREETGAATVLTAHHADDQAETVLFRLLRGTGSLGLSGIPARRSPAVVRPLLDFWRSELEEYAEEVKLSWRQDATNRDPGFARNALRHRILPEVERLVAPGARRALLRLAAVASDEEAAWESVLPTLMRQMDVEVVDRGVSLLRGPFLDLHAAVRARVLRSLVARLGGSLDHGGTLRAVAFAESGMSGRAIELGGEIAFGVELGRLVLVRPLSQGDEDPLEIRDAGPGRGTVVLAGIPLRVAWGGDEAEAHGLAHRFDLDRLRFPLTVRSRRPGDRIRLAAGTKKVKKVLLEGRIPPSERRTVPLLVDAEGDVLWIPGLVHAQDTEPATRTLAIGIGR